MSPEPFAVAADEGRSVWWSRGSIITIKAGPDETGGAFALGEQMCPPNYETPRHVHHSHDELLMLREGSVEFHYDGRVLDADPGDAVYLPKGVPHGFRAGDEVTGILVLYEPGLDQGFLEAGVPADVRAGELPEPPPEIEAAEVLPTLPESADTETLGPL